MQWLMNLKNLARVILVSRVGSGAGVQALEGLRPTADPQGKNDETGDLGGFG